MIFPTFAVPESPLRYVLFQLAAFAATVVYGSFFEWTLHRNVMHKRTWLSWPFELHAVLHHRIFKHDDTYHAQNDYMKEHVMFVPRDYIILLLVNTPVFMAVEAVFRIPVLLGCWASVLTYLACFDILHWRFHVPDNRLLERWSVFQWLKMHHRLHHRQMNRNLNVVVPLADLVFGTRISKFRDEAPGVPAPVPPVLTGSAPKT